MTSSLAVERQGRVGRVILNRPERHNAFDDSLIAELTDALRTIEADEGVRVVILESTGKSFSAGADLEWMRRVASAPKQANRDDAMALAALMRTLAELRKPTIARVQGAAYGGGVGLVACCDIAVAATRARFALSEVKLGLIPAVISPYVVAAIGQRAARRYFLTGEILEASEAWRLGLVHELADDDSALDGKIACLVEALLACAPGARAECKSLIRAVAGRPVTLDLIQDTAERIAKVRSSPEGMEGVGAFLEKRRASWVPAEPAPRKQD